MTKEQNIINLRGKDDLEKIEEDIIEAAEKAGKKNVIVNIFAAPHRALCRRWHVRYRFNKKHLVMDLAIAAGVLFLVGLNIFWWYGGFHYFTDELTLNIAVQAKNPAAGATEFFNGQEIIFSVDYINNNKFGLEDVVLSLKLPKRFELKNVSHSNFDWQNKTLAVENLAPGANGAITVRGLIWGNVAEEQQLIVQANFYKTDKHGQRLWGRFSKSQFYFYQLLTDDNKYRSQFRPNFSGADTLVNGQVVHLPIEITNSVNVAYENVKVAPQWDAELIPLAEKEWLIDKWPAAEKKIFDWQFELNMEKGELKELWVNVYLLHNGEWLKQAGWPMFLMVLRPEFDVFHEAAAGLPVDPGEPAEIVVGYNNDGQFTIENARVELELMGDYWNLNAVEAAGGRIEKNKIIWSVKEWPQLALIQPNEKNERQVKISVKEYVAGSSNLTVKSRVNVRYRLEGQTVEIFGQWQETKLNSNLSLLAYPMYFTKSGDQLGRGPLPPKVGEETKYWIFVKALNDINDVEKVKVSVVLPTNVVWTGKANVPVGDPIQFDETMRLVSWQISKVPRQSENIGFAFEAAIIPLAEQKGTYPALLSSLAVSGTDKVTGKLIEKNLGGLTTQLIYDEIGKKKNGKVK